MSDAVQLAVINGIFTLAGAMIGIWSLREARKAKEAGKSALAETVKGNETVAEVKTLVNGQRDAMVARIAQLESCIRAGGGHVPSAPGSPDKDQTVVYYRPTRGNE